MPYRQSLWRTQISVGPTGREHDLQLADEWEGGDATSESEVFYRATGTVALGGRKTRDEGTATLLYDERLHSIFRDLDAGVGTWKATISRAPLNDDQTPFIGGGFTMTGLVTGVSQPPTNYSANDGATVEITFGLDADLA